MKSIGKKDQLDTFFVQAVDQFYQGYQRNEENEATIKSRKASETFSLVETSISEMEDEAAYWSSFRCLSFINMSYNENLQERYKISEFLMSGWEKEIKLIKSGSILKYYDNNIPNHKLLKLSSFLKENSNFLCDKENSLRLIHNKVSSGNFISEQSN